MAEGLLLTEAAKQRGCDATHHLTQRLSPYRRANVSTLAVPRPHFHTFNERRRFVDSSAPILFNESVQP